MSNTHNKSTRPKRKWTIAQMLAAAVIIVLAFLGYIEKDAALDLIGWPADMDAPTEEPLPPEPTTEPEAAATVENQPADFDFYVLALSWSPDYCATSGADDAQQCSMGKKLGFVLHGLWPQYDKGYPIDCTTFKLPASVKAKFPGLYPSTALYDHEWEKHGTCSGLEPEQYLALSKELKESVTIPSRYKAPEKTIRVTVKQLKQDFVSANSDLSESGLAAYCSGDGRFLKELYVCFSTGGEPIKCSTEIHTRASKSCQNPDFLVRNVR